MKKLMFLGESGTGKTSYISYLLHNRQFQSKHLPTVGVQAGIKALEYDNVYYQQKNDSIKDKQDHKKGKSRFHDEQQIRKQKNSQKSDKSKNINDQNANHVHEYAVIQFWDTAGKHKFHEEICEKFYQQMDAFIILIDLSDENTLKSVNYWTEKIVKLRGSRGYQIGVIANKMDKQRQFSQKDFKKMYPKINYYEEISLNEKSEHGKATKAQQAIYLFIREQIYHGVLPKISNKQKQSEPYCNCVVM